MSQRPLVPLRWYEVLLLRFLANSPRIEQIYVMQDPPEDEAPEDAGELNPRDQQRREEYINYLEAMYQGPSSAD